MGNPVVHFEVIGKDAKKLREFYGKAFDWDIQVMSEMEYGMVSAEGNGGGIGGGIAAAPDDTPGHVTIYVEVPDLDAALKKIEGLGGKTVMPPTTIPDMVSFALFSDPEGHLVGLVKSQPPR